MDESPDKAAAPGAGRMQFGLMALLCAVLNVSLLLAYLRSLDDEWLVFQAAAVLPVAAIIGYAVGRLAGRTQECVFWTLMGAVFAFLAISEVVLLHPSLRIAWPMVGVVSGAVAGAIQPGHPFRRTFWGLVGGGLTMAAHLTGLWWLTGSPQWMMASFEIACAALAGGLMGAFVEGVGWLAQRIKTPRYAVATFLVVTAIAGSWLAARIVPGW